MSCDKKTCCLWLSGFFGALAFINLIKTFLGAYAVSTRIGVYVATSFMSFITFLVFLLISIAFWKCAKMEVKKPAPKQKPRRRR